MTHVGPQNVKTTIDCSQKHDSLNEPILSGSNSIRNVLLNGTGSMLKGNSTSSKGEGNDLNNCTIDTNRILLNIHGHTHESAGICNLGNTTIINPGALKEGKFAIMKLKQEEVEGDGKIKTKKWVHVETRHYDLF